MRIRRNIALIFSILALSAPAWANDWQARHGLTPAEYQKTFDDLNNQGYRLLNVSGYVSGGRELYAALWSKQTGPPWTASHGLSSADYQKAYDDNSKAGYRLVWVSGHQFSGITRYAAIWVKSPGPTRVAKHGLDGNQYQAAFDDLKNQGYRLIHVSGYAVNGAARYAAIWEKSAGPSWIARHAMSAEDYQKAFDANTQSGYRLKVISGYQVGGTEYYAALWDKSDGPYWVARHGISDEHYQNVFDNYRYQGFQPAFLTAFASGGAARMNAIFTNMAFKASDLESIQKAFAGALQSVKVSGLSIAVGKDGRLVYAAGFGHADKENGIEMSVNHRLRIGSISKTVTSVAIFRLIESNTMFNGQAVSLETPVLGPGGILGDKIAVPNLLGPLKTAKLRHFLEHTSGIPSNAGDPIHCASGNLNKRIEYQLAQVKAIPASSTTPPGPVPRPPGATFDYSNLNFNILEAVIERLSGQSYEGYVRHHVFATAGMTTPRLFKIGPYDPGSGEAKHYRANGSYAEYAAVNTCEMKPPGTGAGGWAMTAIDLLHHLTRVDGAAPADVISTSGRAQMIAATAANNGYARGWIVQGWGSCKSSWNVVQGHNGGLSGAFSDLFLLPNGVSFAMIGNQDAISSGFCTPVSTAGSQAKVACGGQNQPVCADEPLSRLVEIVSSVTWPAYNLF